MKLFYILLRFSKNKNYIYQQRNALKKRWLWLGRFVKKKPTK
jgi:hypothetical protein